ncbi:MAG: hypothetical protein LBK61_11465 [Spirochaetaceae bacterium]|jgi:hypothetical protein|nr:hypothetical protein [Spirochaetaceae bacterium]
MNLRIHGDNIIECERTLYLLRQAYKAESQSLAECVYFPSFLLIADDARITVELFAGHNRWGVNIADALASQGAELREAADSYVTLFSPDNGIETLLFAIEYCSALPAGNNAWQRSGRALTCAEAGIPYLYFAEIGGVELDGERTIKAPRFPNPIVPFSYLTASQSFNAICMPIYRSHPAISVALRETFAPVFGYEASLALVRSLIENSGKDAITALESKALSLVKLLADERQRFDTFRGSEWEAFLSLQTAEDKANWLKNQPGKQAWSKKSSSKVIITSTFSRLLSQTQALGCLSVGAKDIPICLLVNGMVSQFTDTLKAIYAADSIHNLAATITKKHAPLLLVWITGFKPRGDDSRPDRGLLPLARMLFGDGIDIMTIVYGPAKEATWQKLQENPSQLAWENGLWHSIIALSDYVLADSATQRDGAYCLTTARSGSRENTPIMFQAAHTAPTFGEHDVDTAIHSLFTGTPALEAASVFECLCNPPGGDWSGISFLGVSGTEYRWTSLPRVSDIQAKRPDHVLQLNLCSGLFFLVIESKLDANDLERDIGERLTAYINELFKIAPTAWKEPDLDWRLYQEATLPVPPYTVIAGGAFRYRENEDLAAIMTTKKLDVVFTFDFKTKPETTALYICRAEKVAFLDTLFTVLSGKFKSALKVQIH